MNTEDIIKLESKLRTDIYGARNTRMKEQAEVRNLQFAVAVPKDFEKYSYIPPTGWAIVENATDQIVIDKPTVEVKPRKDSADAQEDAGILTDYYQSQLWKWHVDAQMPPLREIVKNIMTYGMTVGKICWDSSLYLKKYDIGDGGSVKLREGYQKDIREYNTILLETPDPTTIFPDTARRPRFVIESYERFGSDIKDSWPTWECSEEEMYRLFRWIEYTDIGEYVCIVKDQEIHRIPNPYGFIPYEIAYSGYGKYSPDGKIEDKTIGILWPAIAAIKQQASLKTSYDISLRQNIFPQRVKRRGASVEWNLELGGVTETDNIKEDFILLEQGRLNPDAAMRLAQLDEEIQTATYSDIISGMRMPGLQSGYDTRLHMYGAAKHFDAPQNGVEALLSRLLGRCAQLIETKINEPFPIFYDASKTIKPSNIKGHYLCKVTLETMDPLRDREFIMLGAELYSRGVVDMPFFHEKFLKSPSPPLRKGILRDLILSSPPALQALAMEAIKDFGLESAIQDLMAKGQGLPSPEGGRAYEPRKLMAGGMEQPFQPPVQPGVSR